MYSYTLENLTLEEINLLRQSLNIIEIKGSSAIFVANLQTKLDKEITQIQTMLQEEEKKKQASLAKLEKSIKGNS